MYMHFNVGLSLSWTTAVSVKAVGECGVTGVRFSLLQSLIEEQQSQLNQYESAAGQCVSELQKAQLQVQSLQNKIQESEGSNKVPTNQTKLTFKQMTWSTILF